MEPLQAIVGQNVLLQCPCKKRNERMDIKWQLEDHTTVLHHSGSHNTTNIGEGYQNRVSLFQNEDKDNCSLLLSGITVADNGMYKCFFQTETLVYIHITLNVVGKTLVLLVFLFIVIMLLVDLFVFSSPLFYFINYSISGML